MREKEKALTKRIGVRDGAKRGKKKKGHAVFVVGSTKRW